MDKRLEPHGVGRTMISTAEGPTCEGRVELVTVNIAEALADVREGRTHGPYGTAAEAVAALTKRVV